MPVGRNRKKTHDLRLSVTLITRELSSSHIEKSQLRNEPAILEVKESGLTSEL